MHPWLKLLAAICLGVLAGPYLLWCWSQIAGRGLVFDPLFASGLRGTALEDAVAAADFLVSLLLLAPLALAVRTLGWAHAWRHTLLAGVGMLASTGVVVGLPALPPTIWAAAAIASPFVALAAGVALSLKVSGRAPNNSSKPTPLRGAA
jgi:hypothetical protein